MIYSPTNFLCRRKRRAGFTLVEVMIGATISTLILGGVLAAFLFLIRSGVRTSNYTIMETQTRLAYEQLGIDSRMASGIQSNFTAGAITSFTLTIPNTTLTGTRTVTYVYDTSDPTDKKLVLVPGSNPAAATGRRTLVNKITDLTFLRYNSSSVLVPASTVSDAGVKHIQITVTVSRSAQGVSVASLVIRSSAFTLRNI